MTWPEAPERPVPPLSADAPPRRRLADRGADGVDFGKQTATRIRHLDAGDAASAWEALSAPRGGNGWMPTRPGSR